MKLSKIPKASVIRIIKIVIDVLGIILNIIGHKKEED